MFTRICHLADTPIHAIVMLRQGKTNHVERLLRQGKANHVERLSPFQAFTLLYAQVTINLWNREFVQRAISEIEDLIGQIPVWELTCDISEGRWSAWRMRCLGVGGCRRRA